MWLLSSDTNSSAPLDPLMMFILPPCLCFTTFMPQLAPLASVGIILSHTFKIGLIPRSGRFRWKALSYLRTNSSIPRASATQRSWPINSPSLFFIGSFPIGFRRAVISSDFKKKALLQICSPGGDAEILYRWFWGGIWGDGETLLRASETRLGGRRSWNVVQLQIGWSAMQDYPSLALKPQCWASRNSRPGWESSFSQSHGFSSVQSLSRVWPHESQHARPPCPSQTPRVYSNSCPSSQWCHPAISSSVVVFSSCSQSLPASGSFPTNQFFAWGGQSIGVSASASVLPMNTQDLSPSGWTGWIS